MANGAQNLGTQLGALLFSGNDNTSYLRGQQAGASVQSALEAARLARAKAINQEGQNSAIPLLGEAGTKLGLTPDQSAGYQTLGQAGGGNAVALAKALGLVRGQGYQADARTAALGGDYNAANANLVGLANKPLDLTKIAGGQQYNPLVTPDSGQSITTPLGLADIGLRHAQAGASNASAANSYASAAEHKARIPLLGEMGGGKAPSGYRFTSGGTLEAIPGGPADHSSSVNQGLSDDAITNAAWSDILTGDSGIRGYGKEVAAQRAQIYNTKAKIAKESGVSPQELATTKGRNKALQSSLTNLQKQSDMMQKSEQAFQNNMSVALNLSKQVDRSGSPVVNKWLLGGRSAMGDPTVAALDAAITTAATDYARIMSGQTGAGGTPISTAEEAKKLIRKELSDKQFNAVADVLHQDITGQQAAVDSQRQMIMGHMKEFGAAPTGLGGSSPAPAKMLKYNPATGKIE